MPKPITEQQAEVEATEAQDETVPVRKPKAKKAAPKGKPAKTAAKKAPAKAASNGAVRVSTEDKKLMALKALKALGATSAQTAKSKQDVADKAGLTTLDAYTVLVDDYKLKDKTLAAEGKVKTAEVVGVRGFAYFLTAKGLKEAGK